MPLAMAVVRVSIIIGLPSAADIHGFLSDVIDNH